MDNATENTAANRAVFREGGTLDPNVTAAAPRGVAGARPVVSDAHGGLARAAGEVFPGSSWRRRIAHLERSVADRCRRRRVGGAAAAAADELEAAAPFAPTHPDFPRGHGRWMWANDVQGAGEPRGQAQGEGRDGAPVRGIARQARRRGPPRPGRRLAGPGASHRPAQAARGLRVAGASGRDGRSGETLPHGRRGGVLRRPQEGRVDWTTIDGPGAHHFSPHGYQMKAIPSACIPGP